MKLSSLVAILILTVQQSRTTEEMQMPAPAIKFDKRPFQIYPIDITGHGKVQFYFIIHFLSLNFPSYLPDNRQYTSVGEIS